MTYVSFHPRQFLLEYTSGQIIVAVLLRRSTMFTDNAVWIHFVRKNKRKIYKHVSLCGSQHILQHVILDSGRVNRRVVKNELPTIDRSSYCWRNDWLEFPWKSWAVQTAVNKNSTYGRVLYSKDTSLYRRRTQQTRGYTRTLDVGKDARYSGQRLDCSRATTIAQMPQPQQKDSMYFIDDCVW